MGDYFINATDAKDVALHFYKRKNWRPDAILGRTVNTAKSILSNGYSKTEIISVIDYLFDTSHVDIYSIGYVSHCINDVLDKIKKQNLQAEAKQQQQNIPKPSVEVNSESTERNRNKFTRANSQSNVGAKYNFDLFKERE